MKIHWLTFIVFYFELSTTLIFGQGIAHSERQVQYLSGTGNKHTKVWEFFCTAGRNSGRWTTIEVPSCWEQQGFGEYNYGRDYHTYGKGFKYADESGMYKTEFSVPETWKNKKVNIVFAGAMTDTEVKVNGRSAGPIHQGAFYEFKYDITDKLNPGKTNLLEVKVSKMSSDNSVNRAERYADYWIFGGIFRPVYLEAFPTEHIERVAIDAGADGVFSASVFIQGLTAKKDLKVEIIDRAGFLVAEKTVAAKPGVEELEISLRTENPKLWTAETPNLYRARFSLISKSEICYQTNQKFGFRTIEVRQGDGIYINGTKVKMKGINRHSFWPETGRTLSPDINLNDVQLIKEMNMNAVRCAHYPPDKEFLNYCDSLGLYVINELAGWHNAYDTEVGKKLVREMVIRDVNHPSIIFWSNGNEGGHNTELVNEFAKYDPSGRVVIHAHHKPGNALNGIDCNHYEDYYSTAEILNDTNIYMVTEFLHCQNDGGGGAGLNDYWNLMRSSEKSGGGFLWALLDEGVVRTDRKHSLDVNGVNAPDGVLGPHREKEGSFYAIREIFSPVFIDDFDSGKSFDGSIEIENRFDFLNLNECKFEWKLINYALPADYGTDSEVIDSGVFVTPDINPGERGIIALPIPQKPDSGDALLLNAYGPDEKKIMEWVWKLRDNKNLIDQFRKHAELTSFSTNETDSSLEVRANGMGLLFNKKDGSLIRVTNERNRFQNFGNGPQMVSGTAKFESLEHTSEGNFYQIRVSYAGDLKYAQWRIFKDGWVELEYEYNLSGSYPYSGISFDFPENHVISAKWLGNGPCRVWKNRMKGGTINVWKSAYNNTQTGYSPWIYPEFKGYYSNVVWMELNTVEGKFLMASDEDDLFVRLFDFYALPGKEPQPHLPVGDISFLEHIPPAGTKMGIKINRATEKLGPESGPNHLNGSHKRKLYFYFGTLQSK